MESRFEGRVALVTGAASGIGRASAKLLAREGARVACADISKEKLATTVSEISENGGQAFAIELDVADSASARGAVDQCVDTFGELNILANVAGILRLEQTHRLSDEDWTRVMAVNLNGTFFMSRAAIPHLLKTEGAIVNVSSLAGLKGQAYGAAYCASKAGVVGLTRVMAVEYAQQGLRVNCVCPGAVETPLIADLAPPEGFDPELMGRLSLISKVTAPDEVADAIAFLASPSARSINGVALPIDFGTHAA